MIVPLKIFLARIFVVYPRILRNKILPYNFDYSKYRDSFISKTPPVLDGKLNKAPEIIYVFWTGNNEIPENRQRALNSLIENSGVKIKLVTPDNLNEYVVENYPLHPAYNYLSLVHKSDYLRCYFMHHHGGGYSDVKVGVNSWKKAFERLNGSDKYVLGYREISSGSIPSTNTSIDEYMSKYFFKSIGVCAFIFKPRSPITEELISELHNRLDHYQNKLKANPGNIFGNNQGYPIEWNKILGQIMFPLFFKYNKSIMRDDSIKPIFKNYR